MKLTTMLLFYVPSMFATGIRIGWRAITCHTGAGLDRQIELPFHEH